MVIYRFCISVSGIFIALVVLATCTVQDVSSSYCLECSDVPSATDCSQVKECGPHEVCYASQIVSTAGHIFRRMGCRDRKQCTSGLTVGRRDTSDVLQTVLNGKREQATDIMVCDGCCNTTWCQTELCQDIGYDKDRGPICLECEQQTPDENCTKIKECGRDEVCYEGFQHSAVNHLLRRAGCYSELACNKIGNLGGGSSTCWNCCTDDLCNISCDNKKATTTAATTFTVNPGAVTTACVDATPTQTCHLASAIVCKDAGKASNADCMHYCGFC